LFWKTGSGFGRRVSWFVLMVSLVVFVEVIVWKYGAVGQQGREIFGKVNSRKKKV
jgi:hypothetical protein